MSGKLTKAHEDVVIFCPACGHSHRLGALLASGNENCQRTVQVLTITEWREIADQSDLRLTDAGRHALKEGTAK